MNSGNPKSDIQKLKRGENIKEGGDKHLKHHKKVKKKTKRHLIATRLLVTLARIISFL